MNFIKSTGLCCLPTPESQNQNNVYSCILHSISSSEIRIKWSRLFKLVPSTIEIVVNYHKEFSYTEMTTSTSCHSITTCQVRLLCLDLFRHSFPFIFTISFIFQPLADIVICKDALCKEF